MVKLGIVADDLTGANDTGVQFAKIGLQTIVLWDTKEVEDVSRKPDVIVVDTESRRNPKEEAYTKASSAANVLKKAGANLFYKKIDSTLRGNVGAELDGILDTLGASIAIVSPAYPKNRRVTIGGYQLVEGIPVERTQTARDPTAPITKSHIPTLIGEQSRRKVDHISLTIVMQGLEAIQAKIQEEQEREVSIIVIDAASEDDLRSIAQAASALKETPLLCGSAGLAEEIPNAFHLLPKRRGVLVLAGTMSSVTSHQIDVLEKTMDIEVVTIDSSLMFGGEENRRIAVAKTQGLAKKALDKGKNVVVRSAKSNQEAEEMKKFSTYPKGKDLSQVVLSTFRDIAGALVDRDLVGLILTGGDTAMSVINGLGATGIHIVGEVEAGVPAVTIAGGRWDGLRVVTKAGAFGDDLTLMRAVQYLRWMS